MPEFYGSALVVQWVGTGGTLDISADQRAFGWTPSIQMDDISTSSEGAKSYLTGQTDFTATYKALWQSGTIGTADIEDVLKEGQKGTIYAYPLGSGTGYRKWTLPAISQGVQVNLAYNALIELNVSFQGNGTIGRGTA